MLRRGVRVRRVLGMEHELHQPLAVAEVDERHAAVVPTARTPIRRGRRRSPACSARSSPHACVRIAVLQSLIGSPRSSLCGPVRSGQPVHHIADRAPSPGSPSAEAAERHGRRPRPPALAEDRAYAAPGSIGHLELRLQRAAPRTPPRPGPRRRGARRRAAPPPAGRRPRSTTTKQRGPELAGERRALLAQREEHPIQTQREPDPGRRRSAEHLGEPVVPPAAARRVAPAPARAPPTRTRTSCACSSRARGRAEGRARTRPPPRRARCAPQRSARRTPRTGARRSSGAPSTNGLAAVDLAVEHSERVRPEPRPAVLVELDPRAARGTRSASRGRPAGTRRRRSSSRCSSSPREPTPTQEPVPEHDHLDVGAGSRRPRSSRPRTAGTPGAVPPAAVRAGTGATRSTP